MTRLIARARAAALAALAGLVLAACATPQTEVAPTAVPQAAIAATTAPAVEPTAAPAVEPTAIPAAEPTAIPAVNSGPVADPDDPGAVVLEQFLVALSEGRYEDAAALYAGDYMLLAMYNPELNPEDHAALLRQACEVNGFRCLAPHSIAPASIANAYDVTFRNPDGTVFGVQTAGDASDVHSSFGLLVQETPEGPRPITLPPFVS